MAQGLKVGIAGCGPAGLSHLKGVLAAGGMRIGAVADAAPPRLAAAAALAPDSRTHADLAALCKDPSVDVVAIALPTSLHVQAASLALKAGKHIVLELPATPDLKTGRALLRLLERYPKLTAVPADSRAFSAGDLAAAAAVSRGLLGTVQHVRSSWLRVRGTPRGAILPGDTDGWYTLRQHSGGGVIADLGLPMILSAWRLCGRRPIESVFAVAGPSDGGAAVEQTASLILRFAGGASADITLAWSANIPKSAAGVSTRVIGSRAGLDLYTPPPAGPTLTRDIQPDGSGTSVALKTPKVSGHAALWRHVKEAIAGRVPRELLLAELATGIAALDAAYASIANGKSIEPKRLVETPESALAAAQLPVAEEE